MGKKESKSLLSEDDSLSERLNENGKRVTESQNSQEIKRIKTKSLYRQPTVRELNRLHETETLFNSNLFRLQVEEVLKEVKPKEKNIAKFQQWFDTFRQYMETIPTRDLEYDLSEKTLFKELKVKQSLIKELNKTKCSFKFIKFKRIDIVGSYSLKCPINSKLQVDIQITVPAETYTKNDSVNYRYHRKRAAYLACIASHLKNVDIIEDLKYTWVNSCKSKPVLDLKLNGKLGNHFAVRLYLACEQEAYKLHRFSPSRNNLRESWLLSNENSECNVEIGPPTPYYNSTVLCDLTAINNQLFLKDILENSSNLQDSIVLLKIWLRQRNLNVSGFIISMFVAYLVQTRRINNVMSSYQIVRNVWIALKTSQWDTVGISLHKGEDHTRRLEEFLQHFPVVFLDRSGYYNICSQMHRGTYSALKRESSLAVDLLDNTSINSFLSLFMTPVKPLTQFDHILRFKDLHAIKGSVYKTVDNGSKLNYGIEKTPLVVDTIHTLLSRGLGRRIELIQQLFEDQFSWSVKDPVHKAINKSGYEEKLSFGFILNPEQSLDVVEKGPSANLPEAEQFRSFWGDKSELRRFQDGSITETCVWSGDSLAERRSITAQIVKYLFNLKYGIDKELFYIGDQLDSVVTRKQLTPDGAVGTGEEDTVLVMQAFDELRRNIRGFTDLPLDVSSVYGTSAVFSYSEPLPPRPARAPHRPRVRASAELIKEPASHLPDYTPVSTAIMELGHSGKWPGDLEAFRCLKAAFHLQIAEQLTKQYSLPSQAYPTHVDVLKNGLVFRLAIAHPKEINLLKREIEKGVVKYRDKTESLDLELNTVLLPRLRGALHGLHQKYPAFGPTASLTKRWLSCHLLDESHMPETVVELLAAAVFLRPQPLTPPSMPLAAFLRVLKMLADTDWTKEMIILDFNDEMTREEITELENKFAHREPNAMPRLHIVTSYDGDSPSVWSRRAPSTQVLYRTQVLARSTLAYIEHALLDEHKDNILVSFVPSLKGYDVLIHLHPHLVPYTSERIDRSPELTPRKDVAKEIVPVVEFSPVKQFLWELRSAYDEFALFFHDQYGGDVIAVLWRPGIDEEKEFTVSTANATTLTSLTPKRCVVNKAAIVADWRILGDGLVKDITLT